MVSINVVWALFISRARAIRFTSGWGWFCKKFLVNDGESVFSVRSNGRRSFWKTWAMDLAAHIWTSTWVSFFTIFKHSFSSLLNYSFNLWACSTSTRTPKNRISTKQGNNSVSSSKIEVKSWCKISFFNSCQSS